MRRRRKVSAATAAAFALLAATAAGASAYPSQVTDEYRIETVYGTCVVYVTARADAGLAVIGSLTGTESVHCEPLTITPYRIYLSGGFGGTSLDVVNVTDSDEPDRVCAWQDACYWSRSRAWFPPGDHEVTHDVSIDLTSQSTHSQYFTRLPAGCLVTAPDSGRVICHFGQWVTMPTPSLVSRTARTRGSSGR